MIIKKSLFQGGLQKAIPLGGVEALHLDGQRLDLMDDLFHSLNVIALLVNIQNVLLKHIVIIVVLRILQFPGVKVLLKLQVNWRLVHVLKKVEADVFVLFFKVFEHQQTGYLHENLSLATFQLVLEGLVFFRGGFKDVREVNQMGAFLWVSEVVLTLLPSGFVFLEKLNEVLVVLQLRVNHF